MPHCTRRPMEVGVGRRLVSSILVPLLSLILLASADVASGAEWVHFNRGDDISGVVQAGSDLWVGTRGGLVQFDPQSGRRQFFNKANSPLRSNPVSMVAADPNGAVWVATHETTVQRYRASEWTTLDVEDSGLENAYVFSMAFGPNGRIWFGTWAGLATIQGEVWQTFDDGDFGIPPEFGATSHYVGSMAVAPGGDIWIAVLPLFIPNDATYAGGLAHYDGTTWTGYDRRNSPLTSNIVTSLVVDSRGVLWAGLGNDTYFESRPGGLASFDGRQWRIYNSHNSQLPFDSVGGLHMDTQGALWMLSGGKLVRFDGATCEIYDIPKLRDTFDGITGLWIDAADRKWLGTSKSGLLQFDGSDWSFHDVSNSGLAAATNSFPVATALGVDASNRVWIAEWSAGVVRYDRGEWATFDPSNSTLPGRHATSLAIDPSGRPWVGGFAWLARLDGDSWHVYGESDGLPRNEVTAIDFAAGNVVWLGDNGLVRFDGSQWTRYTRSNSPLPNDILFDVLVDRNGAVWSATLYGLARLNGSQWTVFNSTNSPMPTDYANELALGPDGALWVGTSRGLLRYDGTSWTLYDAANSPLPNDVITALVFDHEAALWVGTWNGPLYRFDGTHWQVFTPENSALPGLGIRSIAVDQNGNKWIGTNEGTIAVYRAGGLGGPVPVLVQDLNATGTPAGVELSWRLAREALDGIAGVDVQAAGASREPWVTRTASPLAAVESMRFVDASPPPGTHLYYRLVLQLRNGVDIVAGPVEVSPLDALDWRATLDVPAWSASDHVRIRYTNPSDRFAVQLAVYDVRGRVVRVLDEGRRDVGRHELSWDRLDTSGGSAARGLYFVRLKVGADVLVRKVAVLR